MRRRRRAPHGRGRRKADMCGIAGRFNFDAQHPVDRQTLEAMTSAVAHRGPDAAGYFRGPGIGLGHRRLSIIDLDSRSAPPTRMVPSGDLTARFKLPDVPPAPSPGIDSGRDRTESSSTATSSGENAAWTASASCYVCVGTSRRGGSGGARSAGRQAALLRRAPRVDRFGSDQSLLRSRRARDCGPRHRRY